jgi:MFS transporter, putative metabolite:H+ symporter
LKRLFTPTVIIAALGYFVDIYDLVLFSIVRIPSLTSLGFSGQQLVDAGILMINWQMIGMLVGGILWGVLADKRGRLSTLYGSIILYSLANLANGAVDTLFWYGFWRFVAGVGLAGELGAGITLVAETAPPNKRGLATAVVAGVGLSGAVLAGFIARFFDWRTCYYIGGALGFALLALRMGVAESGMFKDTKAAGVQRGNFFMLFKDWSVFSKYARCILVGLPVWYIVGILITFSAELGRALHIDGAIVPGTAVALCYAGQVLGDVGSGFASQYFQNRKKVMLIYLLAAFVLAFVYRFADGIGVSAFYVLCFGLGITAGYWILFMTMAAEQFGTNIRGTVTTTVPNFVRGAVVPMTLLFATLKGHIGILDAALYTGIAVYVIALAAWAGMADTFHKDLNYTD